jgi:Ca2+-binding EF-hand superfamily protein
MKKTILALSALTLAFAGSAMANDHGDVSEKVDAKFAKYDTNKDGKLSKSEVDAAKEHKFSEADKNNDGSITKEELTAWKEAKHDKKAH